MTARLFRLTAPQAPEAAILRACLRACGLHRAVAWACRMNSGAVRIDERFVRFHTMPGMSDIIGQMMDGRFLALECKRHGKHPTPDQARFLALVRGSGGVAACVTSAQDTIDVLDRAALLAAAG